MSGKPGEDQNDPINAADLNGKWSWGDTFLVIGIVAMVVVAVVLTVTVVGAVGDVGVVAVEAELGADLAADLAIEAGEGVVDAAADGGVDVVADAGADGAEDASDSFLYRGVTEDHPGYENATKGVAEPRGGPADAAAHNEGWTESEYTSWTTDETEASHWATVGQTGRGAVMRVAVRDVVKRIVASPDLYGESEVLIRGTVTGAFRYFL